MPSSGTYAFQPNIGEITLYAFNLCGIRSTALLQEHMESARLASNMLLGRWSSQGVNLWQVDLQTVNLVAGQSTYTVPNNTIVMLDMYIGITSGSTEIDRLILPISRSEYSTYANKQQQGSPTVAWFDRLLSPTVTLWPVPDGSQSTFKYYRLVQSQDANFTDAQTANIPYYWLEAFAYGIAQRLALIWAPDKAAGLKALADESYSIAAYQNEESGSVYVSPMVNGYWTP